MSKEPNRNVYVGHRYVPLILEEWDKKISYEGLSVVTHKGNSYTSKKRVPVGIDILNKEFWSLTGNYNAQVEYYRQETERVADDLLLKSDKTYVDTELGKKANQTYVDTELGKVDTELGKKANQTYVDTELGKKSNQTYVDTELGKKSDKTYVDTELGKKANQTYVDTELGEKVVKNDLMVNVKDFGATGNGVTDDTESINDALIFSIKNNHILFFPPGTYIIDQIFYDFLDNEELVMKGSGWNTILKRKDNIVSESNRNHYMFSFWTVENETVNNVKAQVEDICFDANHRNNPKPIGSSEYFYERVMTFRIRARATGFIERILFDNVQFLDRISDHISVPGIDTANVGSLELRNVHARKSSNDSIRGDVTISGAIRNLKMTDCQLDKVATELNSSPTFRMYEHINSSMIKELQLTGKLESNVSDCVIDRLTISNPLKVNINNSKIYLYQDPTLNFCNNVHFNGCDFIFIPGAGNTIPRFNFTYGCDVVFTDTNLIIESERVTHYPDSIAFHLANAIDRFKKIKIINCNVDKRFASTIHPSRGGEVTLIDVSFSSSIDQHAIYAQGGNVSDGYQHYDINIVNGNFENVAGDVLRFNGEGRLRFNGVLENVNTGFSASGTGHLTSDIFSNRTLLIDDELELGGSLKGDKAILKDLSNVETGQPYEWIATNNHPTRGDWKVLSTM